MATTQYQIFCRYFNGDINRCVTNKTPCDWISKTDWNALQKYTEDLNNQKLYKALSDAVAGRTKPVRRVKDFSVAEKECWDTFKRLEEIKSLGLKKLMTYEIVEIEPKDELIVSGALTSSILRRLKVNRDLAHYTTIYGQADVSNPKYDMIFMYDGLGQVKGPVFFDGTEHEDYGQFDNATRSGYLYCRNASASDVHQQPYAYYDNMKRINFDIWFEHSVHASLRSAMTKANELVNIVGKDNVKIGKVVPLDKYIEIV